MAGNLGITLDIADWLKIFTIPRGPGQAWDIIQANALQSWLQFEPPPAIFFTGRLDECDPWAELYAADSLEVDCDEDGIPIVSALFREANRLPGIKAYINTDIIMVNDVTPTVALVADAFDEFLIVGQRCDTALNIGLEFDEDWRKTLRAYASIYGQQRGPDALDYFIWRGNLWDDMPEFSVGRMAWDNWLIGWAITHGIPTIDATETILALHPDHPRGNFTQEQVDHNRSLAHLRKFNGDLTVKHSRYKIEAGVIRQARKV